MRTFFLKSFFVVFCLITAAVPVQAFEIVAVDEDGEEVENVAFILTPESGKAAVKPEKVEIKQKNYLFEPRLSTVSVGSTVSFPNMDSAHHHVYSFSEAKQFQFELFRGNSPEVVVDKPGVISLGCNIHDWMLSFLVVVDSPYHAVSDDDGIADFGDVPPGKYKISHWKPGMDERAGPQLMGNIEVKGDERGKLTVSNDPSFRWPRKPHYLGDRY